MSPIVDIQKRFRELGRIRMGKKGARGAPQKLDTWRLTSKYREALEEAAKHYGGTVQEWNDAPGDGDQFELILDTDAIDIVIPPGQTLSQWYEMWSGGGCQKRCDGQRQILRDVPCSCPTDPSEKMDAAAAGNACKPVTRLNVILPKLPDLGVWRLESHGYHAAAELAGMAQISARATAQGHLLPARLRLDSRTVKRPGKPPNHFKVPVIETSATFGEVLASLGAGDGPTMAIGAPVERKQLPGSAPEPENVSFEIEQHRPDAAEEGSMPGAPPPVPASTGVVQVDELVAAYGEKRVVDVAEAFRQELGRGRPIVGIGGIVNAPPEIIAEIANRLDGVVKEDDVVDGELVEVERPCPHCGYECKPWTGGSDRAPKWRCTNASCTGGDGETPWVSWHNDPWKPGGEIEQMRSADVDEAVVTGAASTPGEPVRRPKSQEETTPEDADPPAPDDWGASPPVPSVEGGGEKERLNVAPADALPPGPAVAPSSLGGHSQIVDDHTYYLELINRALDAKEISWSEFCKGALFALSRFPHIKPPPDRRQKTYLKDAPAEFLKDVAGKLRLDERLPV